MPKPGVCGPGIAHRVRFAETMLVKSGLEQSVVDVVDAVLVQGVGDALDHGIELVDKKVHLVPKIGGEIEPERIERGWPHVPRLVITAMVIVIPELHVACEEHLETSCWGGAASLLTSLDDRGQGINQFLRECRRLKNVCDVGHPFIAIARVPSIKSVHAIVDEAR